MIKIALSKEEVASPKQFHSIRWRIELEDFAEENTLTEKIREMQRTINDHIDTQKLRDLK